MPQLIRPTSVRVVPQDGELEITLNINITIDGKVTATAEKVESLSVQQKPDLVLDEDKDEVEHIIPDFLSGVKLNFGKKDKP